MKLAELRQNHVSLRTFTTWILIGLLAGWVVGGVYPNGSNPMKVVTGSFYAGPSYILSREGSTYYCRDGLTGSIEHSSDNFTATWQYALDNLGVSGGKILIRAGTYHISRSVLIPYRAKGITIEGEHGYGKSFYEGGTFILSSITDDAVIKTTLTNPDVSVAFGLKIGNIKFVGPNTADSIALRLSMADTGEISGCTFNRFGKAIVLDYYGREYDVNKMGGKFFIHDNEFAECANNGEYLLFNGTGQLFIHDNCFEAFGGHVRAVNLINVKKARLIGNEFDCDETTYFSEHIRIENLDGMGTLETGEILIADNWAYLHSQQDYWIRQVGTGIWGVKSVGNRIRYGSPPSMTRGHGPYEYPQWIDADDSISHFSDPEYKMKDLTSTFTKNKIYLNNWTWVDFYLNITVGSGAGFHVYIGQSHANLVNVIREGSRGNYYVHFRVPTGFFFEVEEFGGTITINRWYGVYR